MHMPGHPCALSMLCSQAISALSVPAVHKFLSTEPAGLGCMQVQLAGQLAQSGLHKEELAALMALRAKPPEGGASEVPLHHAHVLLLSYSFHMKHTSGGPSPASLFPRSLQHSLSCRHVIGSYQHACAHDRKLQPCSIRALQLPAPHQRLPHQRTYTSVHASCHWHLLRSKFFKVHMVCKFINVHRHIGKCLC